MASGCWRDRSRPSAEQESLRTLLNPLGQVEDAMDHLSKLKQWPGTTVSWQPFRCKHVGGFRQYASKAGHVPKRSIPLVLQLIEPHARTCSDSQNVSDPSIAVLIQQRLPAVSKVP
jgi:hypothetical protein